jgi:hypothetical protein
VRCLYNLCRGENPPVEISKVEPALPILALLLLNNEDVDVLVESCWALLFISNDTSKVQKIIDSNVCSRLVELLKHSSLEVVEIALRVVGNIVTCDKKQTQVILDSSALECFLKLLKKRSEK